MIEHAILIFTWEVGLNNKNNQYFYKRYFLLPDY